MGWIGYYQVLCEKGHDMGGHDPYGHPFERCKHCGAGIGWKNQVDQTNGSFCVTVVYDEDGFIDEEIECDGCEFCDNGRLDGFVELEVEHGAVFCECSCGHRHVVAPPRYKIPR